jgi:hypothetical protein
MRMPAQLTLGNLISTETDSGTGQIVCRSMQKLPLLCKKFQTRGEPSRVGVTQVAADRLTG